MGSQEQTITKRIASQHNYKDGEQTWLDVSFAAKEAAAAEVKQSLPAALKSHRKAVCWILFISLSIVMGAYDTAIIGNMYGLPSFQKNYGNYYPGSGYQISATWQLGVGVAGNVGNAIGIFANGLLTDRFGYKRVLLGSYFLVGALSFMKFFAPSIGVLTAGNLLCGIPLGVFDVIGHTLVSEVCPVVLRGYLQVYNNLIVVIGQLIASGVLKAEATNTTQWAYKIPFAVQWAWLPPLTIIVLFAPESPWWLVRKNDFNGAKKSLRRFTAMSHDEIEGTVSLMIHTNEIEKEIEKSTSYLECFRGTDRWRTEVSCVLWSATNICGFAISSQATYLLEQAGLNASASYGLSVGTSGIALVGSASAWFLSAWFDRRTILLWGAVLMSTTMLTIGFVALAPSSNKAAAWVIGALILVWTFFYDATLGATGYIVIGEISSTRLRVKTICVARSVFAIFSIIQSIATPYIVNPTQGNWKGKAGFLAGGMSVFVTIWVYFRVPETKGRTFEELDIMFRDKVKVKNFKGHKANVYENVENVELR